MAVFLCYKAVFAPKNSKKYKKMQKNAKKLQKNLHISKKSCTFAPSNEKDTNKQPKK